ncbi:MAG: hypothetical protein LBQ94_12500 [Treponema sp.]|nr:hypothetical protein [Treponema sp.]
MIEMLYRRVTLFNMAKFEIISVYTMKVTRKTLLIIIAAMGVLLIAYGMIRQFTGFGEGEEWDRYVTDIVIIIALGIFIYSRK